MNWSGLAVAQLFFPKDRALRLLLVAAALMGALHQSGCAGVATSANGNAVLDPGQFNANTSSINLGNVALGDSKTVALSFTNSTNSSVTILTISVSGPGFSASGVPNGTIVNAGQTATLNITFTPASTGNQSGSITVTSNAQISSITVALQASGVLAGDHSATLSWNSSTSPVIGYFAYRGTTSGGPYVRLNTAADANTTYTDSSVIAGQSYYYVVTAVDSSGVESSYSNEASATIPTP
jgi:Abnormal spindle-like microcephaly-assoc'd, ASPM-SPD-2-Hydin